MERDEQEVEEEPVEPVVSGSGGVDAEVRRINGS